MPKQRLKSETIARRIFDKYIDDLEWFFDVSNLKDCCGFHELHGFPEHSSFESILKTDYDLLEDCFCDDYEDFMKQYDITRVEPFFINHLKNKLENDIKTKSGKYPFIITLLEDQQKLFVDALNEIFEKRENITITHNVVSGSTGNLLAIYVYTPAKV